MSAAICQAAGQALDATVRDLIHATRPAVSSSTDPAEIGEVIASLAAATGMLPQLSDQRARCVSSLQDTARQHLAYLALNDSDGGHWGWLR
jgi:hypothetical protein